MEHLAFGASLFVLGAVLVGAAWLRHELMRDHRALGAAHARLQAEHEQQRAEQVKQTVQLRRLDVRLYDREQDVKQLCERAGVEPYTRGGSEA